MSRLLPVFLFLGALLVHTTAAERVLPADSSSFTFAWLSDTHIGATGADEDLRRVVADINTMPDIAFTIISGDITELDVGDNLLLARSILEELAKPYFVIPGNHDTKWSASGAQTFRRLWGADRFEFQAGPYRFIGLDQGPLMRMGGGYIAPQNITWIDSILSGLSDPRQPFFVVTHYPIDPSVTNWYQLLDLIRQYNVQAILHGHGHRNRGESSEGIDAVMSRSTLSRGDTRTGYTVVQVDPIQAAFTERIPEQPGNSVWHTLPLGNKFPTQPGKVERPDFSVNEQFPTVELLWEQPLGELITAPPAFSAEMAYAVTAEGQIAALDLQKGNKLWTYQTSGGIHGQPLVVDDRVICGSADSSIYCLDAHDGELLWVRRLAGSALNVPVQSGKRIFVAAGEGSFYALDIASGEILWEYHDIDGFVETRPTIKGNRIMFGAWDNRVYALHIRNGKTQWIWQDGPQGILYSPAACWPVASRRQLLFAAPDRALTAVDLRTGETVWRSKERRVRETIGMTPDAEIAFAKCMWDTVIAFRTDHADYDEIWARHVGYGFEIDPSMLVAGAEAVYLTTQNGSIYALDIQNGNVIWQYRLSAALLHTPVLLPDESILLSGVDGIVRRIKFGT